jgi:hypothetical protein
LSAQVTAISVLQVLDGDVIELPASNNYEVSWQIPEDNGQAIDFFLLSYYPVGRLPVCEF